MLKKHVVILLFSVIAIGCSSDDNQTAPGTPAVNTRSFSMGFTPFPYDITQAAVDDVYSKIASDADMITHHFDNGIPWNDAFADSYPYDNHIMDDWSQRLINTPANHKVYVAITPIGITRNVLAPLRDAADDMPLVAPFDTHAANADFNHNDVKTAYLNYCKRVIAYFNPDYLAIGIEVNLLRKETDAATWGKYKELNDFVYISLKAIYPDLAIFASVSAIEMVDGYTLGLPAEFASDPAGYEASQRAVLLDVLSSSDYYAISLYPYMTAFHDTPYPADFLDTLFSLASKPLVIAETGMLAEAVNAFSTDFIGSQVMQDNYLVELFDVLERHNAEFVTWFVIQDYDDLCFSIGPCTGVNLMWRDTGLYDGFGNPRPSHTTWKDQLTHTRN